VKVTRNATSASGATHFTLKIEAALLFETFVSCAITEKCHNTEDSDLRLNI
jgi:hypothetical protein